MSRQTANDNLSLNDTTPPLSSIDKNFDGTPRAPQKKKNKPRIILMGLRRSGKSSIQQVVFHKLVANETLFLESTNQVQTDEIVSFIEFQIWDFPGQIDFSDSSFDSELLTSEGGSVVFVIDAQDDYVDALHKLHSTVAHAYRLNPNLSFEVFIHKVDGLSDDYKIETQREIQMRTMDELADSGLEDIHLSFHLTSIYDHSIFEALSKVIQKLIPQLPTLENLLNILCSNSGIEKAFLFDVSSKIYVATDSSPVDMQSYEICSDMIDVIFDISTIYGPPRTIPESTSQTTIEPSHSSTTTPVILHQSAPNDDKNGTGAAIEACSVDVKTNSVVTANRGATGKTQNQSYSIIKLNNGMALYLREMNKTLALVCLLRVENFEKHGLIDYNFHCFEEALNKIFELRRQHEQ